MSTVYDHMEYLTTTPGDFPYLQQIEQAVEHFDDRKTVELMETADLRWPSGGELAVPTRAEVREFIRRKLTEMAMREHDGHQLHGGFMFMRLRERLAVYFTPTYAEAQADHDEMLIRVHVPGEEEAAGVEPTTTA